MFRKRRRVLRPGIDCLEERYLLAAFNSPTSGLVPAQLTHAYGLDAITFDSNGQTIKGNGSGQTIAIIDAFHDPYLNSDLHTFDQTFGLPDPSLNQVDLAGARTNDGWAGEEALDVEWAHAIAPGASIVVAEARSDSTPNLIAAVNTARRLPGVSVISMSWGGSELRNERTYDRDFTTPAGHNGITFISASGDAGPQGGAQWPASSPNVLSVGGTTLATDAAGDYLGETAWSSSSSGNSVYELEPAYQAVVQSTGKRGTPDVAFDGNPDTGVSVFATNPSNRQATWQVVGGTSLGSPAWAAIIAIADQGRATVGQGSLDGPSQTLPTLYSLPSSDFHAVAIASSTGSHGNHGLSLFARLRTASATLTPSGLGSPNGSALVDGLAFGT